MNERLAGAIGYDRIAGYFSSSILEVAGERIEAMEGKVRVVCNAELEPGDIVSARRAMAAQQQAWRRSEPEAKGMPDNSTRSPISRGWNRCGWNSSAKARTMPCS